MVLEVVRRTVHLGNGDVEILLVSPHLILEERYRYRFTKQERVVRIAAPVDSGVNTVTERDVVGKLMQFAIYRELLGTGVGVKIQAVTGRNHGIDDWIVTLQEELQDGDAGTGHSSVPGRIRRVGGRAFRKRLRKQIAAVAEKAEIESSRA